jgi:hypothetical protein
MLYVMFALGVIEVYSSIVPTQTGKLILLLLTLGIGKSAPQPELIAVYIASKSIPAYSN